MATYYGDTVAKYDAGGSGDNYISDGYIKSVEKIWMSAITIGTTALTTADTVVIARIPPNKKITSVEAFYPALTTENGLTGSTLAIGVIGDVDKFINNVEITVPTALSKYADNTTYACMNNADGMAYVTTGSTTTAIILSIGRKASETTSCTIRTIVRYT
jgi:hypothetical protein